MSIDETYLVLKYFKKSHGSYSYFSLTEEVEDVSIIAIQTKNEIVLKTWKEFWKENGYTFREIRVEGTKETLMIRGDIS
jgi:hypothetical protein